MSFLTRMRSILTKLNQYYPMTFAVGGYSYDDIYSDLANNIGNWSLAKTPYLIDGENQNVTYVSFMCKNHQARYNNQLVQIDVVTENLVPVEYTKVNVCLNTISNLASVLPNTTYWVDSSRMTKAQLIENYGDYLIYDFSNRTGSNTAKPTPIMDVGASQDKQFPASGGQGSLVFGESVIPLIPVFLYNNLSYSFIDNTTHFNGDMKMGMGGNPSGLSIPDLYQCYNCEINGSSYVNPTQLILETSDWSRIRLFSKNVVDEIITDLRGIGLSIGYLDSSLDPASAGPKLETLRIHEASSMTPSFDSDTFEYDVNVTGNLITIQASGDENTVRIGVTDANHLIYNWSSNVSSAIFRYELDLGENTYIVIAEDENGNQTEYTLNFSTAINAPRLSSLTAQNAVINRIFTPNDSGPYVFNTTNSTVVIEWTKNEEVDKLYVNNQEVLGTFLTFRNLAYGYTPVVIKVENTTTNETFTYNASIHRANESDRLPWIRTIITKNNNTGDRYTPSPIENQNSYDYIVDVDSNYNDYTLQIYFGTVLSNISNATVNGANYTPGDNININFAGGVGTTLRFLVNATNAIGTANFSITLRKIDVSNPEIPSHSHGGGGHVFDDSHSHGGGGHSIDEILSYLATYGPGFYGGSFVPNFRYVKPIFTTANGSFDFENGFLQRQSENENAVNYLTSLINLYSRFGKLDAICEAFIHYSNFINDDSGNVNWRYVLPAINVALLRPSTLTKDHITPKNNKCFIYPFSALDINGYGTNSQLAYEEFKHATSDFESGRHRLEFDIFCKWFAGTSIQVVPVNFQQVEDNFDYAVAGPEMPVFPYTKNDYLNEYNASRNTRSQAIQAANETAALQKSKAIFGAATSIGNSIIGAAMSAQKGGAGGTLGIIGAGISVAGTLGSTYYGIKGINLQVNQQKAALAAELADTANRPATVTNQNASPSLPMVIKDGACPFIQHKAIRPEFLKKVDRFFTRFGYRTNRTGIPNIYKRENFCYLECKNAVIGGNIPAEDKQALKAIMEHGITFWHYGSTNFAGVGNYQDSDLTYNAAPYR